MTYKVTPNIMSLNNNLEIVTEDECLGNCSEKEVEEGRAKMKNSLECSCLSPEEEIIEEEEYSKNNPFPFEEEMIEIEEELNN